MKTILHVIVLGLITTISYGQDKQETLFGNVNHIGGFGGPMIEVSTVNGETVADVGGGGALILDNFFFGGYGLGTDAASINVGGENLDIDFGHGGLWFGFVAQPYKLMHLYSSFKLGWGSADLKDNYGDKLFSDNVLVLNPEVGVELNITNWFKLGITGGYRFVDGVTSLPGELNDDSFSSPFGALTFRFGGFGYYDSYDRDDKDFDLDFDF